MSDRTDHDPDEIDVIRNALAGLKFGQVVIAVHDGKIVQVERTEKIRPLAERPPRGRRL